MSDIIFLLAGIIIVLGFIWSYLFERTSIPDNLILITARAKLLRLYPRYITVIIKPINIEVIGKLGIPSKPDDSFK